MKKKLELGSQVDINASFDSGADDTSVIYSVPIEQQGIIEVNATGIVSALAIGTATVEVSDAATGLPLRAIVFQVLSAGDFLIQKELDEGTTDLQIEFVEINSFVSVSGVDEGDNLVAITFTNAMAVENRSFQVGIRAVGSNASSTSLNGRFEYQNGTFSGVGPHTVNLLSAVTDGVYEVYVQDLEDMIIGSSLITINTEDLTPPTVALSAAWSPYTNLVTLTWSTADAETGVISRVLDLRSSDGSSVLIENQNVTADVDNAMTVYVAPNDTTYITTLTVVNGDGLSRTTTATVVVPPEPNMPSLVSAVDNGDNTITVSWMNSVMIEGHLFQIGIREVGSIGNASFSAGRLLWSPTLNITGVGPHSYVLALPNIESGSYEAYVHDYSPVNQTGFGVFSFVRRDTSTPVISLNASYTSGQFTVSWTAIDAETGVTSKLLDIRSSDGSTVLLDNAIVTNDADNSLTLPHPEDGETYVVTFKATNGDGFQGQTSAIINVPEPPSVPQVTSATQQLRAYAISINWSRGVVIAGRTYRVGVQTTGFSEIANAQVVAQGAGPFTQVVTLPSNYTTGTYKAYVKDLTTDEIHYVDFSFMTPQTLVRVNPYMISNTQKGGYAQFASVSSGVASASSVYNGSYDAYVAFDGTFNDGAGWRSASGAASPQWLAYQFASPTTVEAYTLYGCNDGSTHWTAWQLQGSNDGATWATLDTRTDEPRLTGGRNDKRTYELAQAANYTHYRIYVTSLGVHATGHTNLGEMSYQAYGYGSFE